MKTVCIRTETEHRLALLKILFAFVEDAHVYKSAGPDLTSAEDVMREYPKWFPYTIIHEGGRIGAYNEPYRKGTKTFIFPEEACPILEFLSESEEYKVELSKGYVAEIVDDGIKVGCQTFSFEKFDELAEKVLAFRDKSL